jgi:hypothetical protein
VHGDLLGGDTAVLALLTLLVCCRRGEAGFREASVDEAAAGLDLTEAMPEGADQVVWVGEGGVGWLRHCSSDQMPSGVLGSGA